MAKTILAVALSLFVLMSCAMTPGLRPTEAPAWQADLPILPPTPAPQGTVVLDEVASDPAVTRLMAELRQRQIEPQPVDESRIEWLRHARGQSYQLNERVDKERLYVHPYRSIEEARENAADIPPDGSSTIDWVDTPHFYRCENVIVLYLGTDRQVLSALTELCGPQFAGRE